MPETTLCRLCGTENARNATMCAWCETSLTDPFRNARKRHADARPMMVDSRRSSDAIPYGADNSIDRWLAAIGNVLVIFTLHKQEAVDKAGAYYSGPSSHPTSEFPRYGALSIIPSLAFALTIYLLFRWVTRKRNDDHW